MPLPHEIIQSTRSSATSARYRFSRAAFSLVELVIVIVILGVVAAIAVTRTSLAATTAKENNLKQTVTVVRKAMEMYLAEHGQYPGKHPTLGTLGGAGFIGQLTQYTTSDGRVNATLTSNYLYGPYLRAPFPANIYTGLNTVSVIDTAASTAPAKGSTGWVAIFTTGHFGPNMPGSGSVDTTDIVNGRADVGGKTIDLAN